MTQGRGSHWPQEIWIEPLDELPVQKAWAVTIQDGHGEMGFGTTGALKMQFDRMGTAAEEALKYPENEGTSSVRSLLTPGKQL